MPAATQDDATFATPSRDPARYRPLPPGRLTSPPHQASPRVSPTYLLTEHTTTAHTPGTVLPHHAVSPFRYLPTRRRSPTMTFHSLVLVLLAVFLAPSVLAVATENHLPKLKPHVSLSSPEATNLVNSVIDQAWPERRRRTAAQDWSYVRPLKMEMTHF